MSENIEFSDQLIDKICEIKKKVKEKVSYITPVPGGCGPMTIALLMKNTLIAAEKQSNK